MKVLLLSILIFCISFSSFADYGDLIKTFQFRADMFALHPNQKQVYVSSSTERVIRVIDLDNLTVTDTIQVPPRLPGSIYSNSIGMAFSDNGEKLFIASSNRKSIDVFNTQTKTYENSIQIPTEGFDLEMGNNGNLYATPTINNNSPDPSGIMQINTNSMEYLNTFWGGIPIYAQGYLEIDNTRNKLYFGDAGYPTISTKFDVSTSQPVMEWQNTPQSLGDNGLDLALSHNGEWITYMVGGGNRGSGNYPYSIYLMDTVNFEVQGVFSTGAYPREACFSPDDKIFYVAHNNRHLDVWDVETFQKYPDILLQGAYYDDSQELFVDPTGRYLFAEVESTYLKIFDTGREIVPEPASAMLLLLGTVWMRSKHRRNLLHG